MSAALQSSRLFAFPPTQVFAAIADPEALSRWWGPRGFTNEFEIFEFQPGGRWIFTMVGPNGARYANTSRFLEIVPERKVVIRHDCAPFFTLTIHLDPEGAGTRVRWDMVFDDAQVLEAVRAIVVPANEQNYDRLGQVLAGTAVE